MTVAYVQDTILDTTKTVPDPKDATKQIQDQNATLPEGWIRQRVRCLVYGTPLPTPRACR